MSCSSWLSGATKALPNEIYGAFFHVIDCHATSLCGAIARDVRPLRKGTRHEKISHRVVARGLGHFRRRNQLSGFVKGLRTEWAGYFDVPITVENLDIPIYGQTPFSIVQSLHLVLPDRNVDDVDDSPDKGIVNVLDAVSRVKLRTSCKQQDE